MKLYPKLKIKKVAPDEKELTKTERVIKTIALVVAFVTVYFFFFKILFF
ncbi:MAG: hypothetical protein ABIN94_08550 [Ferruginibacter sp.]